MPGLCRLSTTLGVVLALAAVATAADRTETDPPSAELAQQAWALARGWLDAARCDTDRPLPLPESRGVSVVLRLQGRVVGRGTDTAETSCDLARAMRLALHDAADDPLVKFLQDRSANTWGTQACLELELLGAPEVIPGAGAESISSRIGPGLDAVAMRRGERFAWSFPSQEHTSGFAADPLRTLSQLAAELNVGPGAWPAPDVVDSIAVYRASTIRLTQCTPDGQPFLAPRGHAMIAADVPSPAERLALAGQLASWLVGMLPPSELEGPELALSALGLPQEYLPGIDRRDGVAAPPAEQALAAFALARFANLAVIPPGEATRARAAATQVLAALGQVAEIERDPWESPIACALIARAAVELGNANLGEAAALTVAQARQSLAASCADLAGRPRNIVERAVILAAAASLLNQPQSPIDRAAITAALDQLWSQCDPAQLPSCLEWMIDAERSLGRNSELAAHSAQDARRRLTMAQLGSDTDIAPLPPDLHGAFGLSGADRIACAQSSRPGTGLAIMLASPQFTSEAERQSAEQVQQRLLHFLRQLQMDERSCYWAANPTRAAGGVCVAPWSPRMSIAANAQALWCICESEVALGTPSAEPPATPSRTGS